MPCAAAAHLGRVGLEVAVGVGVGVGLGVRVGATVGLGVRVRVRFGVRASVLPPHTCSYDGLSMLPCVYPTHVLTTPGIRW